LREFQDSVRGWADRVTRDTGESPIRYLIGTSGAPEGLFLGGDLEFFIRAIRDADRVALTRYARLSIDVLYQNYRNLDLPITTIGMLRGTTLGAGFESALSCDVIVAEEGIQIGFPEVLFNMFPAMGAYSFLARRIPSAQVERMILSGKLYDAEELYDMGIIDVLAKKGEAEYAARRYMQRGERQSITLRGIRGMRDRVHPVSYEELVDITDLWVDAALSLGERELKSMAWLVRGQDKRVAGYAPAHGIGEASAPTVIGMIPA
jgi:DSF synthase